MRPGKKAILDEVRDNLGGAGIVVLADYRGMSVEQLSDLRGRLRPLSGRVQIVKNSIFAGAADELGWSVSEEILDGPTAAIFGDGDATEIAKTLKGFIKETERPAVKGGYFEAQALTREDVEAMANLPSREVLLGQLVGTIAAPMTQLVGVMNQKVASLLYVLKAVADKKSGEVK